MMWMKQGHREAEYAEVRLGWMFLVMTVYRRECGDWIAKIDNDEGWQRQSGNSTCELAKHWCMEQLGECLLELRAAVADDVIYAEGTDDIQAGCTQAGA